VPLIRRWLPGARFRIAFRRYEEKERGYQGSFGPFGSIMGASKPSGTDRYNGAPLGSAGKVQQSAFGEGGRQQ
jgi:hypothetical protein